MTRTGLKVTCGLLCAAGVAVACAVPRPTLSRHATTRWRIEPSFKYDALCLLNVLTGDPYYLEYYRSEYEALAPKLTPPVRKALADLKHEIKDKGGGIISAWLCLMFSAVPDETLEDMLRTLEDPAPMKKGLEQSGRFDEEGWKQLNLIRDDLSIVLRWMKETAVESEWRQRALPQAEKRIAEVRARVDDYNVIPLVEKQLGKALPTDEIVVYMLAYSQPHGIRITGSRFLTDAAWPFKITVRTATHELMHPPYDLDNDPELRNLMESLRADRFLMDKVENHNPSFGYNSLEGFVEEDCVQALDQLINEKLGLADEPHKRWKANDDGMHVLAVALYQILKEDRYQDRGETFRDALVRILRNGELGHGRIQERHIAMFGP